MLIIIAYFQLDIVAVYYEEFLCYSHPMLGLPTERGFHTSLGKKTPQDENDMPKTAAANPK